MKSFAKSGIALAVMLLVFPAWAADEEAGLINTVSNKALPTATPIRVEPLDDSDDNLVVQKEFERQLRAHGYRLDPDADLVLTFEVSDEIGAFEKTDSRYLVELYAQGSDLGGEDAAARFNVFDSRSGGIINKGRGGTKIITPTMYRMDVTIDSSSGGNRLWYGWAIGDLGKRKSLALVRSMVRPFVDRMGKTHQRESFPLPIAR